MNDFPEVPKGSLRLKPREMISHGEQPVPFDDWLAFGIWLFAFKQAIQWAIGDWINYGETAYGEKYAQALDVMEVSFRTLQNYAWLSKSFPVSRRREALSWSHHEAVKGIKDETEQDALLDIAESQQMGRDELRAIVKKYKQPGLLVVDSVSNHRIIDGRLAKAMMGEDMLFIPDNGEKLPTGPAVLHLYEESE